MGLDWKYKEKEFNFDDGYMADGEFMGFEIFGEEIKVQGNPGYGWFLLEIRNFLKDLVINFEYLGGVHKLRLQDLAFFDHLPPSVYIFYGMNVYKMTTYPPPLVNVVCEGPQS